jgi:penicillin amidase
VHIRAGDEHSRLFAAGFVHAQDRLWQMDMMRRAGQGRLSEVVGEKTLRFDRMFRTLGFRALADSLGASVSDTTRSLLQSYADGVNAYIASAAGRFPVEFDVLDYRPEPWKVEHSLMLARLMAWELNMAWWTDMTFAETAARVGEAKVAEILPGYPDSVHPAVPGSVWKSGRRALAAPMKEYLDLFRAGPGEAGSNAWAVNAARSNNGYAMLANDPHLALPQPSRWYLMHMTSPEVNVSGATLPGLPFVVIGHNGAIAWGLTNAMIDDADFFLIEPDTSAPARYLRGKSSEPVSLRTEVIRISDDDSVEVTIGTTVHGPLIGDAHPLFNREDTTGARQPAPLLALRWAGYEMGDEALAFHRMNRAGTVAEFESGLSLIGVPAQAVVYADTAGNIGYWLAGKVPVREEYSPALPRPGRLKEADWQGYVPFRDLPRPVNPADGVVAAANQPIADRSYPHYLSYFWEPPSRIMRIRELLGGAPQFGVADFKRFQQDITSPFAKDMTALLLRAASAPDPDTVAGDAALLAEALDHLRNWNYRLATNEISASIFNAFYVRLLKNIFLDEMGEELFDNFMMYSGLPNRAAMTLMEHPASDWFDDDATPAAEDRDMILRKSLREGLRELSESLGSGMKQWQWGRLHTVTFRHPFGLVGPLDMVFDIGPHPVGGDMTTLNKTSYKGNNPYGVTVGASLRQIVDMERPLEGLYIITSGQSGQALSEHYDDQTPLWLNGDYLRVTMDWEEIDRLPWRRLTLSPAEVPPVEPAE